MGDMGDAFKEMSKRRKEKRHDNTQASMKLLMQYEINFETKNRGAHVIIQGNKNVIDFWPSTGLFIIRGEKTKHRGVYNLLRNYDIHPRNNRK